MPTYEYQCGTCANRFEKFQSFKDEPVKVCPNCGNAVKKLISSPGIIFKGEGWYANDSRKAKGKGEPAEATAATASSSEAPSTNSVATDMGTVDFGNKTYKAKMEVKDAD